MRYWRAYFVFLFVTITNCSLKANALFFRWYNACPEALDAAESDDLVEVTKKRKYWSFLPAGAAGAAAKSVGFIFYGGAFVSELAYAPILRALAEAGYSAFLLDLPVSFSLLAQNQAGTVIRDFKEEVDTWVVGGHSLGGTSAATYAKRYELAGLALLGSYPAWSLADQDIAAISLGGELDGITSRAEWQNGVDRLPPDARFVEIEGGNHAQMGCYGPQKSDGEATITLEEQQEIVVTELLALLGSLEGEGGSATRLLSPDPGKKKNVMTAALRGANDFTGA